VHENSAATPRQAFKSNMKQKSKRLQRQSCGAVGTTTTTQKHDPLIEGRGKIAPEKVA